MGFLEFKTLYELFTTCAPTGPPTVVATAVTAVLTIGVFATFCTFFVVFLVAFLTSLASTFLTLEACIGASAGDPARAADFNLIHFPSY